MTKYGSKFGGAIQVNFDRQTFGRIERIAAKHDLTKSFVVRSAVEQGIDAVERRFNNQAKGGRQFRSADFDGSEQSRDRANLRLIARAVKTIQSELAAGRVEDAKRLLQANFNLTLSDYFEDD